MPSTKDVDRPRAAVDVARSYLRRERPLSALVVLIAVALFLGAYVATSLLPAIAVAVVLVVAARAPLLGSSGTVRLRTDETPDAVVEAFLGPTPPVLGLQWGIADEVLTHDEGEPHGRSATDVEGEPESEDEPYDERGTGSEVATYRVSYLFGFRSVRMAVRSREEPAPDGVRRVEVEVTADGHPWATYTATIGRGDGRADGRTTVDVAYTADRRFGLRRVPQQWIATRYRDDVLAAQGYTVVERDAGFGLLA